MRKNAIEKRILIGKVDGYKIGRKNCPVYVTLDLSECEKGLVFTACVDVYNHIKSDTLIGGQAFETVIDLYKNLKYNPLFMEIVDLWRKYHLNDMHPGTVEQEQAIQEGIDNNLFLRNDYVTKVAYLQSIDLYEVEYEGKPYKYGSAWLFREIPTEDINRIKKIMGI